MVCKFAKLPSFYRNNILRENCHERVSHFFHKIIFQTVVMVLQQSPRKRLLRNQVRTLFTDNVCTNFSFLLTSTVCSKKLKKSDWVIYFFFYFPETSNDVENQKKSTKKLSAEKGVHIHGKCLYKLFIKKNINSYSIH